MISPISASRLARQSSRIANQAVQRRSISTAGSYETYTAEGIKTASRDVRGPTSKIAVVAKAGTRYQPLPGLTVGLEEFAFKSTAKRSALRIARETELLGGQLKSYHTREALVLEASFLREDLPYFTELLAEVISQTKYTTHEFHEEVESVIRQKQGALAPSASAAALDTAYSVAFHTGLGSAIYPTAASTKSYLSENTVAAYAEAVYNKSNIAFVADGAAQPIVNKWAEVFFKSVPAAAGSNALSINTASTKYFGGEQRLSHSHGNSIVIAFPTASAAEAQVLASLLGGQSNIKWSTGFSVLGKITAKIPGLSISTANSGFTDAGLLTITLDGSSTAVSKGAIETVKALKTIAGGAISAEDLAKAVAQAKFAALDATQTSSGSILTAASGLLFNAPSVAAQVKAIEAVKADKLAKTVKALLEKKATVATVGDLHALPYAEEIGLLV
ncbi:Cytochrome b-c1 complex subunit 2, mitochondrial [Ceratocystis lukuohia]|uniref:Cytochrome b-c1 complex subunit 2, mitochondrial n=1 Tax=Ceratocystis lukuohia TaxID=2019550 RepID=A0ABR4ML93_9PEZI